MQHIMKPKFLIGQVVENTFNQKKYIVLGNRPVKNMNTHMVFVGELGGGMTFKSKLHLTEELLTLCQ